LFTHAAVGGASCSAECNLALSRISLLARDLQREQRLLLFGPQVAIAVLAEAELARIGKNWLTVIGVLITIFEVATVLVIRAHYTMDVFTGVVTGLYAAYLASCISFAGRAEQA
jgi:hypothetical protein